MSAQTNPQLGTGILLGYRTTLTGSGAYTNIGMIISVGNLDITLDDVDNKLLSSTFGPYLPGTPEGEATFTVAHAQGDAAIAAIRAAVSLAPVPIWSFQLTYLNGDTESFTGFAKGYQMKGIENGTRVTADIPIRMNSAPVLTPSS